MAVKPGTYLAWALALISLLAVASSVQNLMLGLDFAYANRHYTAYNNFIIFRQSFDHLINGLNMYAAYPDEHGDYFKYSPAFALLMAPFQLLPVWIGLLIWNLSGTLLLFYGIRSMKPRPDHLFVLVVIMAPEIYTSLANSQSNLHLAGLHLLCFTSLEKQRHGWAAFLLMTGVFIKIFAIALLPLWLFYGRKGKAALWLVFYFLLFAFGPVLVTGLNELIWQYQNWLGLLKQDHDASVGLGLLGLLQAIAATTINKSAILAFGFMLLAVPLIRIKSYGDPLFRVCYFCLLMVWVVLFNHKAESPTFIIPFSAVAAYAICHGFDRKSWFFLIGHLIFTSMSVGDLVPIEIRQSVVEPYRIKAVFPAIFMFWLVYRMFAIRRQPSGTEQLPGVL